MLFCAELLSFKTAFGQLWLAGTIGVRKKLFSKQMILDSNIDDLCSALTETKEPLAPRLSGTLLVGLCVIYKQKYTILHHEMTDLLRKLFPLPANRKPSRPKPASNRELRKLNHAEKLLRDIDIDPGVLTHLPHQILEDDDDQYWEKSRHDWCHVPNGALAASTGLVKPARPIFAARIEDITINASQAGSHVENDLLAALDDALDVEPVAKPGNEEVSPALPEDIFVDSVDPPQREEELMTADRLLRSPPSLWAELQGTDTLTPETVDSAKPTLRRRGGRGVQHFVIDQATTFSEDYLTKRNYRVAHPPPRCPHEETKHRGASEGFVNARFHAMFHLHHKVCNILSERNLPGEVNHTENLYAPEERIGGDDNVPLESPPHYEDLQDDIFGEEVVERLRGIFGVTGIGSPRGLENEMEAQQKHIRPPSLGGSSRRSGDRYSAIGDLGYDPVDDLMADDRSAFEADSPLLGDTGVTYSGMEIVTGTDPNQYMFTAPMTGSAPHHANYTIETWKLRTFIEQCLGKIRAAVALNAKNQDTAAVSANGRNSVASSVNSRTALTDKCLAFHRVVPPRQTTKLIASRTLYHLLVMASNADVTVYQKIPFGRIEISKGTPMFESEDSFEARSMVASPVNTINRKRLSNFGCLTPLSNSSKCSTLEKHRMRISLCS